MAKTKASAPSGQSMPGRKSQFSITLDGQTLTGTVTVTGEELEAKDLIPVVRDWLAVTQVDEPAIRALIAKLKTATDSLASAVAKVTHHKP